VAVTCLFAASYENADISRYYLGPILCVVVWLGGGAAIVVDAALLLRAAPTTGELRGSEEPRLPGDERDWFPLRLAFITSALLVAPAVWVAPATFPAVDLRHDTDAEQWSSWAFASAGEGAVMVTWWSFSTPLWYRQAVLGERADIRIVDDRDRLDEDLGSVDDVIAASLPAHPVYLVREEVELAELRSRWQLLEVPNPNGQQSLYRVVAPINGAAGHGRG
jgi:hypothetical protein